MYIIPHHGYNIPFQMYNINNDMYDIPYQMYNIHNNMYDIPDLSIEISKLTNTTVFWAIIFL